MLPDHASRIFTIASRLRTKTGCVSHEFFRQFIRIDNTITHQVGERHLGSRNQIERGIAAGFELVALEFRQLARAIQCVALYEVRDISLQIAVLRGMNIQHQLNQRTL